MWRALWFAWRWWRGKLPESYTGRAAAAAVLEVLEEVSQSTHSDA